MLMKLTLKMPSAHSISLRDLSAFHSDKRLTSQMKDNRFCRNVKRLNAGVNLITNVVIKKEKICHKLYTESVTDFD